MIGFSFRFRDTVVLAAVGVVGLYFAYRIGLRGYVNYSDGLYLGGYRVLLGDVPYRDFFSEEGMLQSILLGKWMALFGTSWRAFVGYAALENALLAMMTYLLCVRIFRLPTVLGALYALGTAVVFTPPWGVPHPANEGWIFILAAMILQGWAAGQGRPTWGVALCSFATIWLGVATLASKANPGVFYTPFSVILLALAARERQRAALLGSVAAILVLALSAGVLALVLPGMVETLSYYMIGLPYDTAAARTHRIASNFYTGLSVLSMHSPLLGAATAMVPAALLTFWHKRSSSEWDRDRTIQLVIALAAITMSFMLFRISAEPKDGGLAFVFVAIAACHAVIGGRALRDGGTLKAVTSPMVVFSALAGLHFAATVDAKRLATEHGFDLSKPYPRDTAAVIPKLEGVEWFDGTSVYTDIEMMRAVTERLREMKEGTVLGSFNGALYVFADKPPIDATLWYVPGTTVPRMAAPRFGQYYAALLNNMKRHHVTKALVQDWDKIKPMMPAGMICGTAVQRYYTELDLCPGYERFGPLPLLTLINGPQQF
jgi:hypothetical protein